MQLGLAIAELEYFTVGGIIDLIDAYNEDQQEIQNSRKRGNVRNATQTDIDKMFT